MIRFVVVLCALASFASANPLSWRVVGGADAREGQFPYQVSILYDGYHNCGGSIINNRWILTAAHCLYGFSASRMRVAVGSIVFEDPNARTYQVERTIRHEKYSRYSLSNDIGVIRLSEDLEFSDNVQPIELDTEEVGANVTLTLSGFGSTSYRNTRALPELLQWIDLLSLTQENCQEYHWDVTILETHLCTLTRSGEGACYGDSGGPLARDGKLAGIVSFGIPCARGDPDVFTRLSRYIDWVHQNIA